MHWAIGILLFAATVAAMEGVAYVAHRWVMHGPGWFLHASHHRPRTGWWELNDLYAVVFAIPSIVLLLGGVRLGWWWGCTPIGAGIAAYGAIYFGFHDVIVHRRVATRYVPRSSYMKRIVQAHRFHHAVETRRGVVSFGFLWAPRARVLKDAMRTDYKGLKVIVAEGECQLERQRKLKPVVAEKMAKGERHVRVKYGVDEDTCTGDHSCIRLSGCPTLTVKDNPDPLRRDPVATVIDGCVGCGLCGENAHAAVLCPSFYRAEVIQNPTWWDRLWNGNSLGK